MKLLVDALIGKFGSSHYSVDILYGNADSKYFPIVPTGVQEKELIELARKFTHGVVLKNDFLRHSACYYDSNSIGSYCNAAFTDLAFGVPKRRSYVLAYFNKIPAEELCGLLTSIKNAAESPLVNGKFVYSGRIHDANVVIG